MANFVKFGRTVINVDLVRMASDERGITPGGPPQGEVIGYSLTFDRKHKVTFRDDAANAARAYFEGQAGEKGPYSAGVV